MEDNELKSTWDGLKLAKEAEDDLDFDKVVEADDEDDDDEEEEEDSDFDVQLSPSDERLLEELLRLKLTSLPPEATSSLLPGSNRGGLNLFQPRSKLEQFEDILLESQLLEAALPEVTASDSNFESVGFDFEASDAIFKDDTDDEEVENDNQDIEGAVNNQNQTDEQCDCNTCKERMRHKDELLRLRQTWSEVREAVTQVYNLCMCDESREKPDLLPNLKEKLRQLLWRDPHQLYQRLELIVKDFVLEQKVKLIKLLRSQAKNPSLAQEFIQKLLDGYERLCNACQHLSPVMIELESEHLSRFSMTWEVLNKYLHQSIIYSDPIIQNNVPIFISQLRSLYQDNENEGKYTELVRGFLDFDVEMSNIVSFWKNSEKLLEEFNRQQAQLRAKQKMLKEDWERFKAQRRDLKIQMDKDHKDPCLSASPSLIEGIKKCPNFGSKCDCENCNQTSDTKVCIAQQRHQNGSEKAAASSKLAETFPSILTAEGKKSPPREPSPKVEDVEIVLSEEEDDDEDIDEEEEEEEETSDPAVDDLAKTLEGSNLVDGESKSKKAGCKDHKAVQQASNKKATTTAKELRDLMYQHYCVGKGKLKKPSANAIKKGKVPPPACSTLNHEHESSAEDLTDDEDSDNTYSSSEASKATTTTASESHNKNSAHCNCCYCEVFGPGGQSVAPVSRNYPEMRERLRLLLSKKKRKNNQPPPPPPPPKNRASSASSSASSNLRSSRSVDSKKSGTPGPAPSEPPVKPPPTHQPPPVKDDKPLEELLDFIEGNRKSMNEKKKAKKERQKQQKIEEIRKKEEEEKKRKQAEEAERKRREEEIRKQAEMERQLEKKKKKKEAQRIKKLAAKGLLPAESTSTSSSTAPSKSSSTTAFSEVTKEVLSAKDPEAALEELRAKHMRELQELQLMHQRQLEDEAKRLKLKTQQAVAKSTPALSSAMKSSMEVGKSVKRSEALTSKPGTQIKITRTPSGGVEFTTVPAASTASQQPVNPSMNQPTFGRPAMQPQEPPRPSVPSKTGAPMVTIRRIETPNSAEPMVTISMAKNGGKQQPVKEDKLLYTLVNGQAMRTPDAPSDLLPNAKLIEGNNLSKKQKKKLKQKQNQMQQQPTSNQMTSSLPQQISVPMPGAHGGASSPAAFNMPASIPSGVPPPASNKQRPPLPLDSYGKVDLDRLQLPPGISITRMSGPTPERKYFPASASEYGSRDQSVLPLPGTVESQPQAPSGMMDYSAIEGLPPGLNGPNVIVVDTSSLKTKEEEEKEKEEKEKKSKKKKKNKNKNEQQQPEPIAKSATISSMPSYLMPGNTNSAQPQMASQIAPSIPATSNNSLKSGPQVLIKNVNGKVTITPVPGTGATPVNPEDLMKKTKKASPAPTSQPPQPQAQPQMNGKKSPPQVRQLANVMDNSQIQKSHSVPNVNGHVQKNSIETNHDIKYHNLLNDKQKYSFNAADGDDPDKVFAPSNDIEMDLADESDRVVEQFKRCLAEFPSPTDQPRVRPKVELDMKNIFKKKTTFSNSNSNLATNSGEAVNVTQMTTTQ